jgi:sortase A
MIDKRSVDELTVAELEQLLYSRKRAQRRQRLQRMKDDGRLIEIAGLPPPNPKPPPLVRPAVSAGGALRHYVLDGMAADNGRATVDNGGDNDNSGSTGNDALAPAVGAEQERVAGRGIAWRWISNTVLLLVEVAAVVGLLVVIVAVWLTSRELNQELAQVQRAEAAVVALPTPTATPAIRAVVLPGGHKPPVDGRPVDFSEAGNIPSHLLPLINSYVPPPIPTPGPEQARRIQIPAINIDAPIFQGDDQETLKKGVGQHIGTAGPGEKGNMFLSAHNDIYGELFRHLDKLKPGDEFIVSTERQSYTYVVREIRVVDPTEVWVLAPTAHASATLHSCYPYRVNTKRIVVFADLAGESANYGN